VKALYTATATATDAGRNGRTRTDDGKLDLELSMPESMGGPGGAGTNP
jgi:lipoyl-dependent peroxiredoxin